MKEIIELEDSLIVRKSPIMYLDNAVSFRDPYRDLLDLFLERIKDVEGVYGKVCSLYYVLTIYFGLEFHRRCGGRFFSAGFKGVLLYYYFLTLLKRLVMRSDDKLIAEDCVNVEYGGEVAMTPLEDWIDNSDVMRMLNISRRTLQTLRSNGNIPFSRIGNKIYYRRQDIQNMLARNYVRFEIQNEYGKKREKKTA